MLALPAGTRLPLKYSVYMLNTSAMKLPAKVITNINEIRIKLMRMINEEREIINEN